MTDPTEPWLGTVSATNVSSHVSASVPARVIVAATSCGVDFDTGLAVGGALGGVPTVIETVAGADVWDPSLTVNVNESGPL